MLEISTSGLMSGDGKRSGVFRAQSPRPSSTLPKLRFWQCGLNSFLTLAYGDAPHRKLEWQICGATARAVHNGQALATDEPCPRGSLRICTAPAASKTQIPSRCPAAAQTGPSAVDTG